ncbi:MAG TPA: LamG domain-containing protein [Steroidobacteraceae bacterium]|nr:LamG domain-containing protein [Steroidobacteraceae bacterium]
MSIVRLTTHIRAATALAVLATFAACSGGGAPTEVNPVTTPPPVADYTGPAPANADVQAFRINLWENIKASNRCGGCHNAGGQTPNFARNDDVNLAYQAAIALVDLAQPDQSRLVTKVAGGHNCWLASAAACGDTMTVWIRNWAGSVAGGGKTIQLQEPPIKDVGASKTFPESSSLYGSTIWPLVRGQGNCLRCHSPASATPQSPYFAASDVNAAYAAARAKINLDAPGLSRLVVRLREESHNCWTASCANDANTMEAAVRAFANGVPVTPVDPTLQLSKAITLYDGTVAAGGNRFETAQIALYEFKTGMGTTVYDTSGVEPAANLTMSGSIEWVGGWGLNVKTGGKAQGTTSGSKKLADMVKASGEYSIEAWVAPGNVVQEDAYIVSYSGGTMANNATLSQMAYQYQAMTRSSDTDANGMPALLTRAADEDAQASLQHVVLTYDPVNGQRIYVNGQYTGDTDGNGGSLSDWDDSFALVLGNDPSGQRQWTGTLRLVAVHNRALTLPQIQQNFTAGVGERYFMLFNVSQLLNLPKSYVMFESSQYDSYSYLFTKPTFINLDSGVVPNGIALKGLRIGLNGQEARVGQAYIPLDVTVGGSNYVAGSGQLLSNTGTVIALEKGPESDLFFLTFEQLGTATRAYPEEPMPTPPVLADSENPELGLRTFDEINQTMSNITGVPITTTAVASTYDLVKQALPSVESIDAFGSSQQMGIAQLAISYCDAMVEDTALRNAFFGGAPDVNSQTGRDAMITSIVGKAVGTNLTSQPTDGEVRAELNALVTRLAGTCGGSCNATRTATIAKASCAAAIGSGAMLLQ